jgi:hypothetical protein
LPVEVGFYVNFPDGVAVILISVVPQNVSRIHIGLENIAPDTRLYVEPA